MVTIRGGTKWQGRLREIVRKITRGGPVLRVGFLENATYPNGTPVAMIAAIQNFGAPRANIPPRPFFSNMIARKKGEWPAAIAGLLKDNDYDAQKSLSIAGEAIAGQLKRSIIETNAPPLKPATIRRKGFSKPLIHSSNLINSVDYQVRI